MRWANKWVGTVLSLIKLTVLYSQNLSKTPGIWGGNYGFQASIRKSLRTVLRELLWQLLPVGSCFMSLMKSLMKFTLVTPIDHRLRHRGARSAPHCFNKAFYKEDSVCHTWNGLKKLQLLPAHISFLHWLSLSYYDLPKLDRHAKDDKHLALNHGCITSPAAAEKATTVVAVVYDKTAQLLQLSMTRIILVAHPTQRKHCCSQIIMFLCHVKISTRSVNLAAWHKNLYCRAVWILKGCSLKETWIAIEYCQASNSVYFGNRMARIALSTLYTVLDIMYQTYCTGTMHTVPCYIRSGVTDRQMRITR